MASVRKLKKNINDVLSNVIEECYIGQLTSNKDNSEKIEKIIDEAIASFDELIIKINKSDVEDKKKHFKSITTELEKEELKLLDKLEKLIS